MAKKRKVSNTKSKAAPPFNAAFAQLAQLKEQAAKQPAPQKNAPVVHKAQVQTRHLPAQQAANPPPQANTPSYGSEKIVIRRESKDKGKTLTRVSGIAGPVSELQYLAYLMKCKLGCNTFVEDRAIILYGRHDRHAAEWLRSWGAEQVVIERA